MKSKLLIAFSAISLIFAIPTLAQGQGGWGGGGGGGGGQGMAGRAGGFDMGEMQRRWIDRAVTDTDADEDGELSKEEFLVLLTHENYSYLFAIEEDADDEESDEDASETDENGEATADESGGDSDASEDAELTKFQASLFAAADADEDGKLTTDELIDSIDFDAAMQRMRDRMSERGGGNWQRGGQGGQGGGGWPRGGQGGQGGGRP